MTQFALKGPTIYLIDDAGNIQCSIPALELLGIYNDIGVQSKTSTRFFSPVISHNVGTVSKSDGRWHFVTREGNICYLSEAQMNDLLAYAKLQFVEPELDTVDITSCETENSIFFLEFSDKSRLEITFDELTPIFDVIESAQVYATSPHLLRSGRYFVGNRDGKIREIDVRYRRDPHVWHQIILITAESAIKTDLSSLQFMKSAVDNVRELKLQKRRAKFQALEGCVSCAGVRKESGIPHVTK